MILQMVDRPNTTPDCQDFDLESFAVMGTFFKDVLFLHESREGSLEILLVEADFLIRVFFLNYAQMGNILLQMTEFFCPF